MGHSFTRIETQDGFDYTFFSEKSRKLCTVGFDRSINSFDGYSETLQQHGFTMLFNAKYIEDPQPNNESDPLIGETIGVIVKDFLQSSQKETFVVYECESYKDKGVFGKWFAKDTSDLFVKRVVVVEIAENGGGESSIPMSIGFITHSDNPLLQNADDDLNSFIVSFMIN